MKAVFLALIAALSLTACAKNYYEQGYIIPTEQVEKLKVGEQSKQDVQRLLGSPSFETSFNDNTWVYVSTTRYNKPLDQNVLEKRQLLVLNFTNNTLASIEQKTEADGATIEPEKDQIRPKTEGKGLFKQLFGNIAPNM